MKHCSRCDEHKHQSEFQRDKSKKDGLEHWCRECKSKDYKERARARRKAGLCHCGRPTDAESKTCSVCKERSLSWINSGTNRKRCRDNEVKKRREIKEIVFNHYGHKCMCPGGCDITASEHLTVDHINGGGNRHRKEVGVGMAFYQWMIRKNFPPGFRILCYNCNCGRAHQGQCPHEISQPPLLP